MVNLFVFNLICFWSIGLFLLFHNYRNELARWLAYTVLAAGCGSFFISINKVLFPFLELHPELIGSQSRETIRMLSIAASIVYYHLLPYTFFSSAMVFCRLPRSVSAKRWMRLVSLAPLLASLLSITSFYPTLELDVRSVRMWVAAYAIVGIFLFAWGCVKENHPYEKKYKVRICFVVTTTMAYGFVTDYLNIDSIMIAPGGMAVKSGGGYWIYNSIIVMFMAGCFAFYTGKYGFLGLKLRIEKQKFDYSMRALTMGTSILNHSLKNEIQKINYLGERLRGYIKLNNKDKAEETIEYLFQMTRHMQDMVDRIKERTEDVAIKEGRHRLSELIRPVLLQLNPALEDKQIETRLDLHHDAEIVCDGAQLREVFNNLCMNAIDAMNAGKGILEIGVYPNRKEMMVFIKDNGAGISKENADRVFEPFFSTKKTPGNYGLGLSYCFGVLRKHGGSIQILQTGLNQGTTVAVTLPKNRIVNWAHTDRNYSTMTS